MSVVVAIGTRKGLWLARRETAGGAWNIEDPHFLPREVASVGWAPARTEGGPPRLLVGVRSEHWGPTVMRSDDLGASWEETEHGSIRFPEDTGAALERVWQLQPDPRRPDVVWAGCEPTSLWRSEDAGETFDLVRGLWDHPHRSEWYPGFGGAAVHTVIPDPRDENRVLVAMSAGGVYVSDDAGQSWGPSNTGIRADFLPERFPEFGQCVHKVAADAAGTLFAQNHGGVYRSDDRGATWTPIDQGLPADFGFVALAHPARPGTAWVVPLGSDMARVPPGGRLRVQRTDDNGQTWREVGDGLPASSWNTVLRDAACLVEGSLNGAAADSTTTTDPGIVVGTRDGCVYLADDGGETFTEVAAHLPDVLSVRATVVP